METPFREKSHLLVNFLRPKKSELILVFANTKINVERIEKLLKKENLAVDYIHSGLSQGRRQRVLNKFRNKQMPILIATDVAARGLHISNIDYVINYDFPQNLEFYIHRIGRTGRAGASGKAISLISSAREKSQLMSIIRQKKYPLELIDWK